MKHSDSGKVTASGVWQLSIKKESDGEFSHSLSGGWDIRRYLYFHYSEEYDMFINPR